MGEDGMDGFVRETEGDRFLTLQRVATTFFAEAQNQFRVSTLKVAGELLTLISSAMACTFPKELEKPARRGIYHLGGRAFG